MTLVVRMRAVYVSSFELIDIRTTNYLTFTFCTRRVSPDQHLLGGGDFCATNGEWREDNDWEGYSLWRSTVKNGYDPECGRIIVTHPGHAEVQRTTGVDCSRNIGKFFDSCTTGVPNSKTYGKSTIGPLKARKMLSDNIAWKFDVIDGRRRREIFASLASCDLSTNGDGNSDGEGSNCGVDGKDNERNGNRPRTTEWARRPFLVTWVMRMDGTQMTTWEREDTAMRANALQIELGPRRRHWTAVISSILRFAPAFLLQYGTAIDDVCITDLAKELETIQLLPGQHRSSYYRFARVSRMLIRFPNLRNMLMEDDKNRLCTAQKYQRRRKIGKGGRSNCAAGAEIGLGHIDDKRLRNANEERAIVMVQCLMSQLKREREENNTSILQGTHHSTHHNNAVSSAMDNSTKSNEIETSRVGTRTRNVVVRRPPFSAENFYEHTCRAVTTIQNAYEDLQEMNRTSSTMNSFSSFLDSWMKGEGEEASLRDESQTLILDLGKGSMTLRDYLERLTKEWYRTEIFPTRERVTKLIISFRITVMTYFEPLVQMEGNRGVNSGYCRERDMAQTTELEKTLSIIPRRDVTTSDGVVVEYANSVEQHVEREVQSTYDSMENRSVPKYSGGRKPSTSRVSSPSEYGEEDIITSEEGETDPRRRTSETGTVERHREQDVNDRMEIDANDVFKQTVGVPEVFLRLRVAPLRGYSKEQEMEVDRIASPVGQLRDDQMDGVPAVHLRLRVAPPTGYSKEKDKEVERVAKDGSGQKSETTSHSSHWTKGLRPFDDYVDNKLPPGGEEIPAPPPIPCQGSGTSCTRSHEKRNNSSNFALNRKGHVYRRSFGLLCNSCCDSIWTPWMSPSVQSLKPVQRISSAYEDGGGMEGGSNRQKRSRIGKKTALKMFLDRDLLRSVYVAPKHRANVYVNYAQLEYMRAVAWRAAAAEQWRESIDNVYVKADGNDVHRMTSCVEKKTLHEFKIHAGASAFLVPKRQS